MKCPLRTKGADASIPDHGVCALVDLAVLWVCRERIKKNDAVSNSAQIAFSKKAEQVTTVPHGMQTAPARATHPARGR
ncbi:MAG: hypothetical protein ABS69_02015 [Nitrosomonadales bacterium SCN 54-20]|nr:MAG: hypothetical protein ABS69_02015 [Nitrosomonadales bacterium SCN 54-20]